MWNKNLKAQFWIVLAGVSMLSKPVFAQEVVQDEETKDLASIVKTLPVDAPLKVDVQLSEEEVKELRQIRKDLGRLAEVRKILAEKPKTAEQKKNEENVLRLRLSAGGTGSNTLGFNAHAGANGLLKLKLSDSQDPQKKAEKPVDLATRKRSYVEVEVGLKAGIHATGVPASASARGEYRGEVGFDGGKVSLGGGVTADLEENHNPLGPKYGSETVGVRGKVGVANDILVLNAGVGVGEVHIPGIYGVGGRAHAELALDLSKLLSQLRTEDQESTTVALRYDFFRNVPSASNIHRAKVVINIPVTTTTSVEGAFQVTDQAALSSDLVKRTDFAGTVTYNGSFDLYQLWDGADQAKRLIDIVQASDGK